jgi:hypothetical protein
MKVTFRDSNFEVTFEGKDTKDIFEQLAGFQEVFSHKTPSGNPGRFSVREDKENNKYYELVDFAKKQRLQFGQKKKGGTLFPKKWVPLYEDHDDGDNNNNDDSL